MMMRMMRMMINFQGVKRPGKQVMVREGVNEIRNQAIEGLLHNSITLLLHMNVET